MDEDPVCEGSLYVPVPKLGKQCWVESYCAIEGRHFYAYQRIRDDFPANKSNTSNNILLEFQIKLGECECKRAKLTLAEIADISKASNLREVPYYFIVSLKDGQRFTIGAPTERDRARWMIFMKNLSKPRTRPSGAWVTSGFMGTAKDASDHKKNNRFDPLPPTAADGEMRPSSPALPSQRQGMKIEKPKPPQLSRSQSANPALTRRRRREDSDVGSKIDQNNNSQNLTSQDKHDAVKGRDGDNQQQVYADDEFVQSQQHQQQQQQHPLQQQQEELNHKMKDQVGDTAAAEGEDHDEEEEEQTRRFLGFTRPNKICGVKLDTLIRLWKVCLAFPFVIVVSSLNLSNHYTFLRSVTGVRIMNILIYVAPVVYVRFVLSQTESIAIQRLAIGAYILLYLLPVFYVVFSKVKASRSTHNIEDGTFCFRPARTVRWTMANLFALSGFGFEWLQHILYVLPLGIVTGDEQTKLSDFPPFLPFELYFWACIAATVAAGLIIVLNAVLQGKLHYRFQNSYVVWFFVYNVGSPMFVTFVTIFFMSLRCDFGEDPPVLVQQPSIICYSERHVLMARAGLVGLAVYIIQNTLLPSGTFKETMRDNSLDILFVPVYLQAHFLFKAVFCGIYVFFYTDNFFRVISLTVINITLLVLNNFMKPCSVNWVNVMRDCIFVHATLSGIQSINYLVWPVNGSTKSMVISTLASNVIFSTIGMYVYYRYFRRSTEYTIATAFLDLEWQVSRGGSVHPRVLEPLISLTLSDKEEDWEIAKKYIGQLVWLISYPNMRVQFQSAWGLANLALLDEDARVRIHEAGGTKALFEWYTDMAPIVQLEVLAAMANLTLSMDVAEEMVMRNKCITFFILLVVSNKLKHSQFAAIALSNLARKETFRELIRRCGGIPALVGCIMSHDYQKRRHGARALANMALSSQKEIEQVFESVGLIDRIIKMTLRKEIETQREFVALIRNLACHGCLRPLLLERNVMTAVEASKTSLFPEVVEWCSEITTLMERENNPHSKPASDIDMELLNSMEPLEGRVEWSTWGSKLESIFSSVFSTLPTLVSSQVITTVNCSTQIHLPVGLSRGQLQRWRDSLSYAVIERPAHGKLSEYATSSDYVLYTPHEGYCGTDFFTYRMVLGSMETSPATVAITIGTAAEVEELLSSENTGGVASYRNSNRTSGFLAAAAAAATAGVAELGGLASGVAELGGLSSGTKGGGGGVRARKGSLVRNDGYKRGTRAAAAAVQLSMDTDKDRKRSDGKDNDGDDDDDDDDHNRNDDGDIEMGPTGYRSLAKREHSYVAQQKGVSFDSSASEKIHSPQQRPHTQSLSQPPSAGRPSSLSPTKSPDRKSKTTFKKQRSSEATAVSGKNVGSLAAENVSGKQKAVEYSAHPFTDTLMKKMSVRRSGDADALPPGSPSRIAAAGTSASGAADKSSTDGTTTAAGAVAAAAEGVNGPSSSSSSSSSKHRNSPSRVAGSNSRISTNKSIGSGSGSRGNSPIVNRPASRRGQQQQQQQQKQQQQKSSDEHDLLAMDML